MDKRIIKTRKNIFQAFLKLIDTKAFDAITVQEIIEEAGISRSTFYSHYETKDHLLRDLCDDLVDHVFIQENAKLHTSELTHLFRHFLNNSNKVASLLMSDSYYFNNWLVERLDIHLYDYLKKDGYRFKPDLDEAYQRRMLTVSFIETVKWALNGKETFSPEKLTTYFETLIS